MVLSFWCVSLLLLLAGLAESLSCGRWAELRCARRPDLTPMVCKKLYARRPVNRVSRCLKCPCQLAAIEQVTESTRTSPPPTEGTTSVAPTTSAAVTTQPPPALTSTPKPKPKGISRLPPASHLGKTQLKCEKFGVPPVCFTQGSDNQLTSPSNPVTLTKEQVNFLTSAAAGPEKRTLWVRVPNGTIISNMTRNHRSKSKCQSQAGCATALDQNDGKWQVVCCQTGKNGAKWADAVIHHGTLLENVTFQWVNDTLITNNHLVFNIKLPEGVSLKVNKQGKYVLSAKAAAEKPGQTQQGTQDTSVGKENPTTQKPKKNQPSDQNRLQLRETVNTLQALTVVASGFDLPGIKSEREHKGKLPLHTCRRESPEVVKVHAAFARYYAHNFFSPFHACREGCVLTHPTLRYSDLVLATPGCSRDLAAIDEHSDWQDEEALKKTKHRAPAHLCERGQTSNCQFERRLVFWRLIDLDLTEDPMERKDYNYRADRLRMCGYNESNLLDKHQGEFPLWRLVPEGNLPEGQPINKTLNIGGGSQGICKAKTAVSSISKSLSRFALWRQEFSTQAQNGSNCITATQDGQYANDTVLLLFQCTTKTVTVLPCGEDGTPVKVAAQLPRPSGKSTGIPSGVLRKLQQLFS
nr:MAG: hypothetical protein [Jingmen rodent arterivirus 1]